MSDTLLRSKLIRLASTLPKGSAEKKALLEVLASTPKTAAHENEALFSELSNAILRANSSLGEAVTRTQFAARAVGDAREELDTVRALLPNLVKALGLGR